MLRLFADGGCLWDGNGVGSRSTIGGTYSWVIVEEDDRIVCEKSGVIEASVLGYSAGEQLPTVTNNVSELYSLAFGILNVEEGVDVHVYSDSQCALGRIFRQHTLNGVPPWLIRLTCNARDHIMKLGRTPYTMLAGHPTKAELVLGRSIERKGKDGKIYREGGLPVSKWNKVCDEEAKKAGVRWQQERAAIE